MDTLILRDDCFLAHDPGPGHHENARRLQAVYDDLDARSIPGTRSLTPRPADRKELERIHQPGYVDRIDYNAFLEGIRDDIAEAAQQVKDLRDLEEQVERYLNRKFARAEPRPRKRANSKQPEKESMITVEFGPNGLPL